MEAGVVRGLGGESGGKYLEGGFVVHPERMVCEPGGRGEGGERC